MEWYFKVKASTDLEAKRTARNMAIEALRKKNMIGRWFEVQDVEWLQKGLFGDGVLAKVHVYVKDNKIMKNAKIRSFLAQEFRDLKARLSKKSFKDAVDTLRVRIKAYQYGKDGEYSWYAEETNGQRATGLSTKYFKTAEEAIAAGKKEVQKYSTNSTKWVIVDNKPKSQREVWLTGLSAIKDSLNRFKDSYDIIREHISHNGCDISIVESGMKGTFWFVVEKNGKKKKSVNVFKSALEAKEEAKHTAESFNDAAVNDDKQGTIIKTVKHGNFSINVTVDKDGSYGFILRHGYNTVAAKNNLGSEQNAIDVAKATANSFGNLYDAAINDIDISSLCNKYHIDESEMKKIISAIKRNAKGKKVSYRNMPEIGGYLYETFSKVAKDLGYEMSMLDSAIKDGIVRRVDYKGCSIWIGKQYEDYSYSVYTRNSFGSPLAWDCGYKSEEEALSAAKKSAEMIAKKFGDSAEYINDRQIDIKKDGKLIDVVNAETLDEAVRIYERQHPELRGQIDAYFSDEKVKDSKIVTREEWESAKKHGYTSIINGKKYMLMADPKAGTVLAPVEVKDSEVEDGFEEEWSKLMFKMKRLQMNPNTKWSEMEALNEEMNALKKKYGKND